MIHIAVALTHFSSPIHFTTVWAVNPTNQFFSSLFFIAVVVVAVQLMPIILFHYFFSIAVFGRCGEIHVYLFFFQLLKRSSWSLNGKQKRIHHHVIVPWKGPRVKRSSRNAYKHTRISDFLFIDFGSYLLKHAMSPTICTLCAHCSLVCLSSPKYHISDLIFANHRDCRRQRWSTERHHHMIYARNSQRKYWYAIQTILRSHSD